MTTTDARKRHAETKAAEQLCRVLHELEWRADDQGRTTACATCQRHTERLLGHAGFPHLQAIGIGPNGCVDMEDYARIFNEGYTRAQRHAHQLVRDLPTRIISTEPLAPANDQPLLSEYVVRRADLLAAFPAIPLADGELDDTADAGEEYLVADLVACAACAEKASNQ